MVARATKLSCCLEPCQWMRTDPSPEALDKLNAVV